MLVGAVMLGAGLLDDARGSSRSGSATSPTGVGVGVAVACVYVPMVAMVGGWFVRQRTAALGIAVAGIGVGTLVLAPLSGRLIDAHGWRTAYVVARHRRRGPCCCSPASERVGRPSISPSPRSRSGGSSRDRGFVILYVSIVLLSSALFVPVRVHQVVRDGRGHRRRPGGGTGRHHRRQRAWSAGSVSARSAAASTPTRLMQLSFATMAASFAIWLVAGDRYAVLVVFAIVMGVSYGGFIALSPAVTAGLFGTVGLGGVLGACRTPPPGSAASSARRSSATSSTACRTRLASCVSMTLVGCGGGGRCGCCRPTSAQ